MDNWKEALMSGDEWPPTIAGKGLSQSIYEALGNSKKVLVTHCIGLKNQDGSGVIDLEESPWCHEPKGSIKPANRDLALEIQRRQKLFVAASEKNNSSSKALSMKPKNKSRETMIVWLNEWPVIEQSCVQFLLAEANRVRAVLQTALDESRENSLAIQHGAWSGQVPYLRLIHCITDCDENRSAFLKRNDMKTREELDAARSPIRPKSAYDMIAEWWNCPLFNPKTKVSTCHVDFDIEIDLSYSKVANLLPADALSIQNWLSTIRATLLRIIDKWERKWSGRLWADA